MAPMTMAERILARACGREEVSPGDIVEARADLLYMHEMLALALGPFNEIGITKVWDPTKIVVTLDHWVPPPNEQIAKMHQQIRDFCRRQGITRFHDIGDHGIVHQLIAERGYAQPGKLIIGSDSHTNMVGACGAFAAGGGATDVVAGEGTLGRHVYAKDLILKVIATTGDDGARYQAVEFTGRTIRAMPMHERL